LQIRQGSGVGPQQRSGAAAKHERKRPVGDAASDILDFEQAVVAVDGFGVVARSAATERTIVPSEVSKSEQRTQDTTRMPVEDLRSKRVMYITSR